MDNLLRLKKILGPGGLLFFEKEGCEELTEYDCSNNPIVHYIGNMIETVGLKILIYLEPKIFIPNTEEIGYSAIDIDTASHLLKGNLGEMKLGTYKDELYRGHNYLTLSKSKLMSITDVKDQYLYILDRFIESLERYFKYFNIETKSLFVSYEKIKENDFYRGVVLSKYDKKKVAASIQRLDNLKFTKWKFELSDYSKKILYTKHLKDFDYYGRRILNGEWIQFDDNEETLAGSFISIDEWVNDVFYFTWGFPGINSEIEYYEFSLKTMELTQKK